MFSTFTKLRHRAVATGSALTFARAEPAEPVALADCACARCAARWPAVVAVRALGRVMPCVACHALGAVALGAE